MADWLISRNMNMTLEKVVTLMLHPEINASSGNPAAAPNTLQDWGFLQLDKTPTEMGAALLLNKISWPETVLLALSKRGSNDASVPIKPFVAFCKVLSVLHSNGPDLAYLTPQAFARLLTIRTYSDLTEDFCLHINDGNGGDGSYRDIWYNALTETNLFIRRPDKGNGVIGPLESRPIIDFIAFVAQHGDIISDCPIKSVDNVGYFEYMGSMKTGIVEILKDAPPELIDAVFPHYFSIQKVDFRRNRPDQVSILSLLDFVKEVSANSNVARLNYSVSLISRFVAALLSRPFVVLTGLSGSGKTKLAQAFTTWLSLNVKPKTRQPKCFTTGLVIPSARSNQTVVMVGDIGLIVAQGNDKCTCLSYEIINEWVETIKEKGFTKETSSGEIKDEVIKSHPKYSPYLHAFDPVLKALAFFQIEHEGIGCGCSDFCNALLVPVGADWTNSEHLLGYPDALQPGKYVMPDTGVLQLMLTARDNPNLPFFLILDEMNLSHVERYFADFLSAMESGDEIKLYGGAPRKADDGTDVPPTIKFPPNLFVIGTMNVDETTYMFSPKVLDRAQVIEFRVSEKEMQDFLANPTVPDLAAIKGKGAKYAEAFLKLRDNQPPLDASGSSVNKDAIVGALNKFFPELAKLGAEFGYRTAGEVVRFCAYYIAAGADVDNAIDAAIVQKLLPKLHGSQARLGPVLRKLKELASKETMTMVDGEQKKTLVSLYKLTCDKIERMQERLKANGFTSFAEA